MSTIAHFAAPPAGYRFMSAHEAESMEYADPVVLWNGEKHHGVVTGFTDEAMKVTLRSGAVVSLDLDHPDYWPVDESRDRRPPNDGELVAIRSTEATPEDEIEPLLRAGVALATSAKNDPELQEAMAVLRRIVSERLRGRAA